MTEPPSELTQAELVAKYGPRIRLDEYDVEPPADDVPDEELTQPELVARYRPNAYRPRLTTTNH